MSTITQEKALTEFAEKVYVEQKAQFIKNISDQLRESIEVGRAQIKNGQYMTIEESEARINKEFFSNA